MRLYWPKAEAVEGPMETTAADASEIAALDAIRVVRPRNQSTALIEVHPAA
jgi:hypothetical protein